MNNINKLDTLGQIVSKYPYTVDVLNKYKIDYSFKGDLTLNEVLLKKNLSEYDVVGELDLAIDEFRLTNVEAIYWQNEPLDRILDYIEKKHHQFMKKTLNEINVLLLEILKNHFKEQSDHLLKLHRLFGSLKVDMESHLIKEEENLFPLLRSYALKKNKRLRLKIIKYMGDTQNEHDVAGQLFQEINYLTDNYRAPADASSEFKKAYKLLDILEKDTFNHVHMENSILFKMV